MRRLTRSWMLWVKQLRVLNRFSGFINFWLRSKIWRRSKTLRETKTLCGFKILCESKFFRGPEYASVLM